MEATITSKGQVTLPKALREALSLSTGDKLSFVLSGDGEVRMTPKHSPVQKLKGILPAPDSPVSLAEMKSAIQIGGSRL
ncbi:MAG: AbrB/MazE/SpoVT family DNA-binding domain-containing protein [Verrucomicrobia bacterium]|nr:AbrB/MazE/SpoVT family DNA-binding domain-containing protein [Verrucomicrobiota bacterium]